MLETQTYSLQELAFVVSRYGRSVSPKSLRKWLPWALIPLRKEYTSRDLRKLVFFAHQLNRIRNFQLAQQKLIEDLNLNPHKYQTDYGATIDVQSHA